MNDSGEGQEESSCQRKCYRWARWSQQPGENPGSGTELGQCEHSCEGRVPVSRDTLKRVVNSEEEVTGRLDKDY